MTYIFPEDRIIVEAGSSLRIMILAKKVTIKLINPWQNLIREYFTKEIL